MDCRFCLIKGEREHAISDPDGRTRGVPQRTANGAVPPTLSRSDGHLRAIICCMCAGKGGFGKHPWLSSEPRVCG